MSTFAPRARIGALISLVLLAAPAVRAASPTREVTREECLEAHGKGQDAREAGHFTQAGELFLTCAQPTCPVLVQSDCARFVDELQKLQPTVTFAARDAAQNDLPDTSVFVDGTLAASRLGDGKAYEVNPGRHQVRFVHAGREAVLDVVVNQGEKGRSLVGAFPSPPAPAVAPSPPAPVQARASAPAPAPPEPAEQKRPAGPLVLVGLGVAAAVAGGVLLGVGLAKIPARCNLRTNECAAPPDDPVFAQASSGVTLANIGGVVGGAGVVTLVGSLIGYFAQPLRPIRPTTGLLPWACPQGAGLSFAGSL